MRNGKGLRENIQRDGFDLRLIVELTWMQIQLLAQLLVDDLWVTRDLVPRLVGKSVNPLSCHNFGDNKTSPLGEP